MRILILNYEFPPLGGGAANATYYLLKEFAKNQELTIDLVTSSTGKEKQEQFANTINIYYLNIRKSDQLHHQTYRELLNYSWHALRWSKQLAKVKSYDLVHAFFGVPCGFIAMQLRLPYIVSLRGSDVPFYSERYKFLDRFVFQHLSKEIWKKAGAVIANSTQLADLAHHTLPNLDIPIIPNGVDMDEFFPSPIEPSSESEMKVICVTRITERKRVDLLIEAIAKLKQEQPQITLDIIGEGVIRKELEQQANVLGVSDHVNFRGALPHNRLAEEYRAAHIFALPSKNEGMSNTALEALASGLPMILTNTGSGKKLVDGNGILIPANDVNALTQAILRLANDRDARQLYRKESRKKAAEFSWAATAEAYITHYKNLVQ